MTTVARTEQRRVQTLIRSSEQEKAELQRRAAAAGVTVNEYLLAKGLDRDFEPPLPTHPVKKQTLPGTEEWPTGT